MANLIVAQLLYLDSADAGKDVTLYINSPGGSVTAGAPQGRGRAAWSHGRAWGSVPPAVRLFGQAQQLAGGRQRGCVAGSSSWN